MDCSICTSHADGLKDILETRDQPPFYACKGGVAQDFYELTGFIIRTLLGSSGPLRLWGAGESWGGGAASGPRFFVEVDAPETRVAEPEARQKGEGLGWKKREFKLPRREARPPNHLDDTVDSGQ